jgi:hypothetical protein
MTWWQKTLAGIGVGLVLFLAGYLVRWITQPAPVVTTTTLTVHDTTTVPGPTVYLTPNPAPARPRPIDSTAQKKLDSVLATVKDKDALIARLAGPKEMDQRFESATPNNVNVTGMLALGFYPDPTGKTDGVFDTAMKLDSIKLQTKIMYVTKTVEVGGGLDLGLAAGILAGGIAAGVVTGVLISK